MTPTREQVIQMALDAGAVEMRENCLNTDAFPWGCEMEIDQLMRFYAAAHAQALDEAIKDVRKTAHEWAPNSLMRACVLAAARNLKALKGKQ